MCGKRISEVKTPIDCGKTFRSMVTEDQTLLVFCGAVCAGEMIQRLGNAIVEAVRQ
jgi:hypothetical protein